MLRHFFEWLVAIFREHDCKRHGHDYMSRYDDLIDPRFTSDQVGSLIRSSICSPGTVTNAVRAKIYVRDICRFCGDCADRLEGLTEMEVIAHQARRISK